MTVDPYSYTAAQEPMDESQLEAISPPEELISLGFTDEVAIDDEPKNTRRWPIFAAIVIIPVILGIALGWSASRSLGVIGVVAWVTLGWSGFFALIDRDPGWLRLRWPTVLGLALTAAAIPGVLFSAALLFADTYSP